MVLQRSHRGDEHDRARSQVADATGDVEELLHAHVGRESRLGHHVLAKLQPDPIGDERVVAVRDVRERSAVDEGRLTFERLHQVRLDRVLEDDGKSSCGLDVLGRDRLALVRLPDGDPAEPLAQVGEIAGHGDETHDLARSGDVEARLARRAVRPATEAGDDVPEVPVVHVHAAPPGDGERVEARCVPVMEMRVDQRREQVVRCRDRVEVSREVEVQVLHRDDLRITASSRASLHAEHRPERRFPQAQDGLAAEDTEALRERDRRRRLSLAGRSGRDRCDVDQLGVGPVSESIDHGQVDLRLVATVRLDLVVEQSELVGDVADRTEARGLSDLEAGGHGRAHRSPFSDSPLPRPARRRGCRCGTAPLRTVR